MLAVIIAAFCVEAMAGPERDGLSPIEGRWVAEKRSLTLDLVRCGASWCGVEVKDGKTCGAVALRFELVPASTDFPRDALRGRLELASEPKRYMVDVSFLAEGGVPKMIISGNPGERFEPWRRNFPFHELMARTADPSCAPVPKLS